MHSTKDRAELARAQASAFAIAEGATPERAEQFADEYAVVLEDRAHEISYPDAPSPTPEAVWWS